mgnify:FL=1
MNKACCRCKETKDISMFYRDKNRKDGRRYNCKVCSEISTKKWRDNNPDKYSKYNCNPRRNKEIRAKSKLRSKTNRENLTDSYIRDLITMQNTSLKPKDIPNSLVKLWRINLKLKRALGLTAIKQQ